jgi:hypothetical protein
MEDAEVQLLRLSLELLIEMVQGPCSGNQDEIIKKDGFIAVLEKVSIALVSLRGSRLSLPIAMEILKLDCCFAFRRANRQGLATCC